MSLSKLRSTGSGLHKSLFPTIVMLASICGSAALASPPKQVASVPAEYRPTAGAEYPEPVSIQDFYFRVDKETGQVRLMVDYGYPDLIAFGRDGGAGPQATSAELPGLKVDSANQTVVFEDGGHNTVCGQVKHGRFLFWKHEWVASTGACEVTGKVNEHHGGVTLDTYFATR